MKNSEITKENLRKMTVTFYAKVLKNKEVGPFFIERLGDDLTSERWGQHLDLLTEFWASFTIGNSNYNGNPFAPHMSMDGLSRETFSEWLVLFHNTLDLVYEDGVADGLKQRSSMIAQNFMRNLGI